MTMSEMIKIAANGQWSLEKSHDKNADAERRALIDKYLAQKKTQDKPPKPAASGPNYPAGMRPASVSTQNHRGGPSQSQRTAAPPSKDEVAQLRARSEPDPNERRVIERTNISKPEPLVKPKAKAVEHLPPQEMITDPSSGAKSMQVRQGKFHNEGATTRGKIVMQGIGYENPQTKEKGFRQIPRLEQHHWQWDHNEKKWNHVGTTLTHAETGTK
jgi:hypothetical protein